MAKYDGAEGNSGHIHLSLRTHGGGLAFAGDGKEDRHGMSDLMARFLAGQLASTPDLLLLFAPTINSYKRLRPGSFAPSTLAWGRDNRTCALRVIGSGPSLRFEHRVPGADANPYLVLAGIIAAGLHGIDNHIELQRATTGSASSQHRPRLPATLEQALTAWTGSTMAKEAFGPDVVTHLAAASHAELDAFAEHVTDWERRRGFART